MPGTVVLSGGDEFSPRSQPLNEALLRLTGKPEPHVVIVPIAADNPGKVARTGIYCLSALGAHVEWTMTDSESVSDRASVPLTSIETAHALFLPDGNPLSAITGLTKTEALAKIRRTWDRGAVLAASGAGAMALCDLFWDSGEWEQGLGLLKGIVILPHYELMIGRFSAERLRRDLPDSYTILALDTAMGVVIQAAQQECSVLGPDFVTVHRAGQTEEFSNGQGFSLTTPVG